MAEPGSVLENVETMIEIWDSISGIGQALIVIGGILLLGSMAEDENFASADIPTIGQIEASGKRLKALEAQLEMLHSGGPGASDSLQWEPQTRETMKRIEKYRHELFAPGALEEIDRALKDAAGFRADGFHQAAADTLYQAWQLARITEQRVLEGEKAWEEASVDYLTRFGCLQKLLQAMPNMPVEFTTDQGKETLTMDADFWSEGRVTALQEGLPEQELPRDLTLEQVHQRSGLINERTSALSEAAHGAVEAFMASQQRMDVCDAVYTAFADRGWILDEEGENGFEKEDSRRDISLSLRSAADDRLVFTFSGAGRISMKAQFQGVQNRGLKDHLERILRQALTENGMSLSEQTTGA